MFVFVLIAILPQPARAIWQAEKISSQQIDAFASGQVDGDRIGFYASAGGNINNGRVFEIIRGDHGWADQQIYSSGVSATGIQVGNTCGSRRALFIGRRDTSILRLDPDGGGWSVVQIRAGLSGGDAAASGRFPLADVQTLKLNDGSTVYIALDPSADAEELKCRTHGWGSTYDVIMTPTRSPVVGQGMVPQPSLKPGAVLLQILASGVVHGDGVRRYYGRALGFAPSPVFELSPEGRGWGVRYLVIPSGIPRSYADHFIIGDVRGEGKGSLYLIYSDGVYEYHWNGSQFDAMSQLGKMQPSPFGGIAVGGFRPDRRVRLYASDVSYIHEYTFTGSGWRDDRTDPVLGPIRFFSAARAAGESVESLFFTIIDAGGIYRLVWKDGDLVAVADFRHDKQIGPESAAFSEMLRTKIVQIGNCKVLEREQMASILAERNFKVTGAMTSASATEMGRLLDAKKVVVGTVGTLFSSRVAAVNSVSVATGKIERSEFGQWRDAVEMERVADRLAQAICPVQKERTRAP